MGNEEQAIELDHYDILTRAIFSHGLSEMLRMLASPDTVVIINDDGLFISDLNRCPLVHRTVLFINPELSASRGDLREYLNYNKDYVNRRDYAWYSGS